MDTNAEDLRFKKAAQRLLQLDMGIIPSILLNGQIDRDAADLLVEHGLLLYTDDLLMESDDWESDGYLKLLPEYDKWSFVQHLLMFDILPSKWYSTFSIPDDWKQRLSTNTIDYLNSVPIYREQLNPLQLSQNISERPFDMNHEQEKNVDFDSLNCPMNNDEKNVNSAMKRIRKNPLLNFDSLGADTSISPTETTPDGSINQSDVIQNLDDELPSKNRKKKAEKRIHDSQCLTVESQPSLKRLREENDKSDSVFELHHQSMLMNPPIMSWNQLRSSIIGLPNRNGSNCYINAVIQCFANTPPFVNYLLNETDISFACHLIKEAKFCSICELSQIVSCIHRLSNGDSIVLDDINLLHSRIGTFPVQKLSSDFTPKSQEDASLFIVNLLDHCAACLTSSMLANPKFPHSNTVIDQIFGMKLLSTIKCLSCSTITEKRDVSRMLMLEVNNLFSLTEALQHFFSPETLTGSEAYRCSKCNDLVDAQKALIIHEPSPILILSFKRSTTNGQRTRKLMHRINYDQLLDISPYLNFQSLDNSSSNHNNRRVDQSFYYKLYCVIIHSGVNAKNGHFIAYLLTAKDAWFKIDDENVQEVLLTEVVNNQSAFVLFYANTSKSSTNTHVLSNQRKSSSASSHNDLLLKNISFSDAQAAVNKSSEQCCSIPDHDQPSFDREFSSSIMIMTPSRNNPLTVEAEAFSNDLSDVGIEETASVTEPRPGYTDSQIIIGDPKRLSMQSKTVENESEYDSEISPIEKSNHSKLRTENCKKLASIASGVAIEETYEEELSPVHHFRLTQSNLVEVKEIREKDLKKSRGRKLIAMGLQPDLPSTSSSGSKTKRTNMSLNDITNHTNNINNLSSDKVKVKVKVDIEYLNILLPYLKHYNSACALCVCTRYFGRNISKPTSLLLKCVLKCNGSECKFKCVVHVLNDGQCFVVALNRKIFHRVGERYSRPIRGLRRRRIMEKFRAGASVFRVHAEYDQQRTEKEKRGFNYDATGKTKKVFKKIKAESVSESLLSPDFQIGIVNLHDELVDKLNSDGIVKGALQIVQLRPFCVVSYMESSIRLYDAIVTDSNSVLSWDATGGMVKSVSATEKQILYYELTIAHPGVVDEDTLIPITFMLSESQSLLSVIQWLAKFKDSYNKVYPHKKENFPRPAVILSDRAQVFLQGALRIFNEESYKQFMSRAYRIVTKNAMPDDLSKTNIHACLAHFMLDMRKLVNRYLVEDIRELAMWCMALLVNTNTWDEMKGNWRLICLVFWNYNSVDNAPIERYYASLLSRIEKISNDRNLSETVEYSQSIPSTSYDPFDFDNENVEKDVVSQVRYLNENIETSDTVDKRLQSRTSRVKNDRLIVDEEQEYNQVDSSFKRDLQKIYDDCCQDNHLIEHLSSSVSKATKASRDWLSCIMRSIIPTIPIWSNLLLGNYSRYTNASIRAYNKLLTTTHDQRTNSISERRMCIVKRTQLGSQTRLRPDVVLQILVQDAQRITEAFSISLLYQSTNNTNSRQNKLKEIRELWNKSNRRGRGHYAKKPESIPLMNLTSALIVSSSEINDNLSLPNLSAPTWLNVSIGLLLSIATIRQSPPQSTVMRTPLLIDIANFIENWILASGNTRCKKKTNAVQKRLLHTDFDIPPNISIDPVEQSIYILHNVLLPMIAQPMLGIKTYMCTACKFLTRTHITINYIPINVVNGQILLCNELITYFISSTSDVLCNKCSFPMTRRIELLDCPQVIIVAVNDIQTATRVSRKPPSKIGFQPFMNPLSIGCSSSTIFDIVGFLSIPPSTANQKLILATKIKKRWQISSTQKMIGDGEQLCQFFARSRIIILECVRSSNTNFLSAIAECCSSSNAVDDDHFDGSYKTLRDAIKQIEENASLQYLQLNLSSNITNYYQCPNCNASPNSLSSTYDCICIYEQTGNSEITAVPFIWNTDSMNLQCSACKQNVNNLILTTFRQTHQRCPFTLIYHSSRMTRDQAISLRIKLVDNCTQLPRIYQVVSGLLVDEYKSISLVKFGLSNNLTVYCQSPYTTPTPMSDTEINDLFTTALANVLFCQIINDTDSNTNRLEVSQLTTSQTTTPIVLRTPYTIRLTGESSSNPMARTGSRITIISGKKSDSTQNNSANRST